jgi:acyl-CoA reductase-like NAD-dependent aldehyde dehydrogenase
VASLAWHARRLQGILGPRRLRGKAWWQLGQRHWVLREPVGRVLVIATWNYPLQLLGVQLAQALAAGNEVTVKPSERCPRTQTALVGLAWRAMDEAGLDRSRLRLAAATRDEGARLLRDERFDHVVFTGSTAVGRRIAEACAATLTPSTLELSGRDSAIVLADADPALAAKAIWHAVTMNAGQTCMAPRRVLIEAGAWNGFIAALRPLAAAGRPLRLVDGDAAARTHQAAVDAIARGGWSVSGVCEPPDGPWLRPLAVADGPTDGALADGEHFGPAIALHRVEHLDAALRRHAAVGQALATAIFTARPERVQQWCATLGSSIVTVNDCILPSGHPGSALSGRGPSGWGSSRGAAGLLALTREVTVSVTSRWMRTPLDEPTPDVVRWMRRLAAFPYRPRSSDPRSG